MSKRLIVIPRWAGTPGADWYPWLRDQLRAMQPAIFDPVVLANMPNPGQPTISSWVSEVNRLLGSDPDEAAQTVLVGHSVGCQAIMRAMAEWPDALHVDGVLFVAGWFWTDAPWDTLMPWIETPFDPVRARAAAGRQIEVLISDNDRHTGDWRSNRQTWEDRMGASVTLVPGANHFNGERYPIILQTLLDQFAAAKPPVRPAS